MNTKDKINEFFTKLPFKGFVENIPAEKMAKVPVLKKLIPWANQIVSGLALVLVIIIIAASSGGGGPKDLAKEYYKLSRQAYSAASNPAKAESLLRKTEKHYAKVEKLSDEKQAVYMAEIARLVNGKKESGSSGGSAKAVSGGAASGGKAAQPNSGKPVVAPASDFEYDLTKDGNGVMIIKYKGPGGNIIIPSEIEGMPVTQLGGYNMYGESYGYVFSDTKVTSVALPDSIKNYNAPGMFAGSALKEITFPKGITEIPESWFTDCKSLTSITIPETVEIIQDGAFEGSNLSSIVIPKGVVDIGNGAFRYCKNLKSVTLPESIEWIGDYTFEDCNNLEAISLPSHKITYHFYTSRRNIFDMSSTRTFEGCTKLSLASRKAIKDTGYRGDFN